MASLAVTVSLGYAWPTATAGLTAGATVAEGLLWLVISAGLAVAAARKPDAPQTADVSMPRGLALAFSLAFLGAAVTPVAWLTGWTPDAAIVHLLRALFVFALVTTLYGMVLRTRSARLVAATTRLQQIQEQFAGVEKLVAVGTLAAGAAHDFNNSLTVILSRAELLALNPAELSASARAHVDAIEKSARAAATVTRNLLGIARRQGGTQLYGGLAEMLEVPLESLRREFARRRITVETRFDPVPTPPVDLGLLVQVFLNLYLNARDAMIATGGGTLRVSMRHIGGEIEIAVADSGTGVPESFRDRIFQPLQTTKGAGGTGLGLSVSKAMLESMGGTIRYDSREGHGSTFYVTLPAAAAGATASPAQAVA
ncbi:MAG: sensor histidine kinase [Vicinamibacterales bacterium]